jgi:hypothetical protein
MAFRDHVKGAAQLMWLQPEDDSTATYRPEVSNAFLNSL